MNGWSLTVGIVLLFVGIGIMLWAPYGIQVWGIFALAFSAMLIWASGYSKEEKK